MSKSKRERVEQQRRDQYHQGNFAREGQQEREAAQVLQTLSEVDDLPIQPQDDPIMGQLVSELTSTANLSAEEVESNKWVREYLLILYLSRHPTEDGSHGSWRGWQHGDNSENLEPMSAKKRTELEAFVGMSKLALSRSEDAKAMEESLRNVSESHVNEPGSEGSGGSGLLGKLGL